MAWNTLVVDDDPVHGQMLVECLHEAGWEASAVAGITDALARMRSGRYRLVVSDVWMDDGDGFVLLRAIRAEANPVPVILMSSFATGATEQEALDAGAFAFLTKPFPPGALLELVARAQEMACD